uniref:Uncharacterized protein n=1 Tax=Kalanchoe fedtschenkoi TaxID=63787 RepID=A0A7N0VIX3_KALFE
MILLRYLKVDQSGLVDLSWVIMIPYISEISNLQVLILNSKDSEHTTDLPKGIWKLKFLRHIYVRKKATMPGAQSSHDSLPYLQTLSCIIYEEHTSKMLCPARFPNLRKLSVHVDHQNPLGAETLQTLCKLLHFVSLKISYDTYRWESSGPLYVDSFPSTLTKIHLDNTALTSNSWRLLAELKNLQVLKLRTRKTDTSCEEEMFVKQPLVFKAEAFPQLLHLKLRTHHPALILENGALRTLQYLIIRNWLLADLPYKLWLSTTLRQVKIIEPSSSLSSYIQSLDDSKHSKLPLKIINSQSPAFHVGNTLQLSFRSWLERPNVHCKAAGRNLKASPLDNLLDESGSQGQIVQASLWLRRWLTSCACSSLMRRVVVIHLNEASVLHPVRSLGIRGFSCFHRF